MSASKRQAPRADLTEADRQKLRDELSTRHAVPTTEAELTLFNRRRAAVLKQRRAK